MKRNYKKELVLTIISGLSIAMFYGWFTAEIIIEFLK